MTISCISTLASQARPSWGKILWKIPDYPQELKIAVDFSGEGGEKVI